MDTSKSRVWRRLPLQRWTKLLDGIASAWGADPSAPPELSNNSAAEEEAPLLESPPPPPFASPDARLVRRSNRALGAKDNKIAVLRCALATSAARRRNSERVQRNWRHKAAVLSQTNRELRIENKSAPSSAFKRSVSRAAKAKLATKVLSVLGRAAKMEKHQARAWKLYHAMKKHDSRRMAKFKIQQKEKASAYDFSNPTSMSIIPRLMSNMPGPAPRTFNPLSNTLSPRLICQRQRLTHLIPCLTCPSPHLIC